MKSFNPELMGRAALTRIDHGDALTWPTVADRIDGFGKALSKRELELVVGYLAASILTRSASVADAKVAALREAADALPESLDRDRDGVSASRRYWLRERADNLEAGGVL